MPATEVLVFIPSISNRINYTFQVLFEQLMGVSYQLTDNREDYLHFAGIKINYASTETYPLPGLKFHASSLLWENEIKTQTINIDWYNEKIPSFFSVAAGGELNFDPFACAFYLLSRYEEYLPFTPDQHGRFQGTQSLAYQGGFLTKPVVVQWAQLVAQKIQNAYPEFQPKWPGYSFTPSYDIDIPWAFRHRGLRGIPRAILDLVSGSSELRKERIQVWRKQKKDPFDTFAFLDDLHKDFSGQPVFFWLLGDLYNNRFDTNPNVKGREFQALIKQNFDHYKIGIHPSYQAFSSKQQLQKECHRFESITGELPSHSRQHFLLLQFPHTYRTLIRAGIQHDYSMGYADQIGYRAGTTEPYLWYDLEEEKITGLWVHPFAAMDVTLKQYLRFSPAQAIDQLRNMKQFCVENDLSFCTLWHNSSFSDLHGWKGWRTVYESLFDK